MKLSSSVLLHLEPTQAVALWLEKPETWLPFHPHLSEVETLGHTTEPDGSVAVKRRWMGSLEGCPAVLKPFIAGRDCAWTETITWVPDERLATWSRQAAHLPWWQALGATRLTTGGSGPHKKTRWLIEGELSVEPDAFTPAPRFLRERLRGALELFAKSLGGWGASLEASALTRAMEQWAGANDGHEAETEGVDTQAPTDVDSDDG